MYYALHIYGYNHDYALEKKGTIKGSQMTTLGGGLYNTLSLFNHSCDPCFMRANVGNAVLCITVRYSRWNERPQAKLTFCHRI